MGRIFCLAGKSGAGKDTIFRRLIRDRSLGLRGVVPYTTRPRRSGEAEGREYHFIDENTLHSLQQTGKIIEMRRYQTVHGVWYYGTVDDGQIDLDSGNYLLIATLEGIGNLKRVFGRAAVPIYIEVDDGERLARALRRERRSRRPDYAEMCRRYLADEKDFSEEKLAACGIEYRCRNQELEKCVQEISGEIRRILSLD